MLFLLLFVLFCLFVFFMKSRLVNFTIHFPLFMLVGWCFIFIRLRLPWSPKLRLRWSHLNNSRHSLKSRAFKSNYVDIVKDILGWVYGCLLTEAKYTVLFKFLIVSVSPSLTFAYIV